MIQIEPLLRPRNGSHSQESYSAGLLHSSEENVSAMSPGDLRMNFSQGHSLSHLCD